MHKCYTRIQSDSVSSNALLESTILVKCLGHVARDKFNVSNLPKDCSFWIHRSRLTRSFQYPTSATSTSLRCPCGGTKLACSQ